MTAVRNIFSIFLTCTTVAFLQCSSLPTTASGGTGSETAIGKIINEDGTPATSTVVTLLPGTFDPVYGLSVVELCSDTTNEKGEYRLPFIDLNAAEYCLQAQNLVLRTATLLTGITPRHTGPTPVATVMLHKTSILSVTISDTTAQTGGYIYVPGSTLFAKVTNGKATIDSAPAGFIPVLYYVDISDTSRNHRIKSDITTTPGGISLFADTTIWKYSKELHLNTTPSGADVAGAVYNFPILVRLNAATFDFRTAKNDGGDIQFTKQDNSPLPHEIERWDAISGKAEIWVKVDTVYGNDSSHSIIMYWGNPNAKNASRSAAVFDTANGFQGVWHMGQAGNTTATDATLNRYDGTPYGMTAASAVEGAIGVGQTFDGTSSYIQMQGSANGKCNFPENGYYSVSAWIYTDTLGSDLHMIIGKGHEQYYLKLRDVPDPDIEFVEHHSGIGWQICESPSAPALNTWHYVVGVRNGLNQSLYIDGALISSTIRLTAGTIARNTSDDVSIGKYLRAVTYLQNEGFCYFRGKIDEARISSVAIGADWVKLCYMNQKADDALIR